MNLFFMKEDFEFLKRLFEILVKTYLTLHSTFPEKNFDPIENLLNSFTKDFDYLWTLIEGVFEYKSLSLCFKFKDETVTYCINNLFKEIDSISEQIYCLIEKEKNISKDFSRLFQVFSCNSMLSNAGEKNVENLII